MTKTRPKMTVGEAFESLTGVDTDAIEHHYGHSIYHWPDDHKDPWDYARALALPFIARGEPGYDDDDAYEAAYRKARRLTVKQAKDFFADDDDVAAELESGEGSTPDA